VDVQLMASIGGIGRDRPLDVDTGMTLRKPVGLALHDGRLQAEPASEKVSWVTPAPSSHAPGTATRCDYASWKRRAHQCGR
jgi:hypothetical protein